MNNPITTIVSAKGEPRIDSRLMAGHLGVKHPHLFEQVKNYKADFEALGLLRFQTGKACGGRPEKFVLLTEDQSYLLLTYSKNTKQVRALKLNLVKAFREARRAVDIRKLEYLPEYHALHDAIKAKANGSANERFHHLNANREINKLAGVQPGQRATSGRMQQSLLTIGNALAAKAVAQSKGGSVHRIIKAAIEPLRGAMLLAGGHDVR